MSALFESWTGLPLRNPAFLAVALLLVPALLWRWRRGAAAVRFAPAVLLRTPALVAPAFAGANGVLVLRERFPGSWRVALRWLPRALQGAGIVLAVVALARPVAREPVPARSEGIDIVLCLDTSSSMTANDMDRQRTRLEVAKDAAARFVEGRPDDRIGLITFARFPDLRCPLTLDHRALARILADVATTPGDGPEDATGIGTAVARAAQVLQGAGGRSRVAILLTDGEENVALVGVPGEIAPAHAAQLCRELGVRVYAIAAGVGRTKPSGERVALDTRAIASLASRTGGTFFEAKDAGAVATVYAQVDRMERSEFVEARERLVDRFLGFLLAGVALIVLGRLLEATVLGTAP